MFFKKKTNQPFRNCVIQFKQALFTKWNSFNDSQSLEHYGFIHSVPSDFFGYHVKYEEVILNLVPIIRIGLITIEEYIVCKLYLF